MIAESGCVGVCLFVLGEGGGQNAYLLRSGPAVQRQLCTVYSISSTPQPSPPSVTHTPCAHHCPSLPTTPTFPQCWNLLTMQFIHAFVYRANYMQRVTYLLIPVYMYLYVCTTHGINWSNRRSWSRPFLLPNCPFEGLWWQDAMKMTSLSYLYSAGTGLFMDLKAPKYIDSHFWFEMEISILLPQRSSVRCLWTSSAFLGVRAKKPM